MIRKGLYRHFKGNFYRVTRVAQHCEDESWWVTYQALYGKKGFWIRALDDFDQMIERNGKRQRRFEYCDQQSLITENIKFKVVAGLNYKFEQQFEQFQCLLVDAKQYVDHSLQRDQHNNSDYLLSITWLPDPQQNQDFQRTPAYRQFEEKLGLFLAADSTQSQFLSPICQ